MKPILLMLLLAAVATTGCTSRAKARADARAAFYAGQARAMSEQLEGRKTATAGRDSVSILGPVQVSALKWTPDLTLVKTIVAAEYIPDGEPSRIIIHRNGDAIQISPLRLLDGEDIPILRGDVVELRP